MTEEQNAHPLIAALAAAANNKDRAMLAQLRGSMAEGREALAYPFVARYFGHGRRESDLILVAQLFALHPSMGPQSLARALRVPRKSSDSVELRFRALLDADREDLPVHLRHAVSLAKAHKQPIDYQDLLDTIRGWNGPHKRRAWARDFWGMSASQTNNQEGTAS